MVKECGTCVFTGVTGNLMEDHKDGDWKKYDSGDRRVNQYQTILTSINSVKRGVCKKCQKTKIRPKSPDGHVLDYTHGDKNYGYPHFCSGCFICDPVKFRKEEREYFLKDYKNKIENLEEKNRQLQLQRL